VIRRAWRRFEILSDAHVVNCRATFDGPNPLWYIDG